MIRSVPKRTELGRSWYFPVTVFRENTPRESHAEPRALVPRLDQELREHHGGLVKPKIVFFGRSGGVLRPKRSAGLVDPDRADRAGFRPPRATAGAAEESVLFRRDETVWEGIFESVHSCKSTPKHRAGPWLHLGVPNGGRLSVLRRAIRNPSTIVGPDRPENAASTRRVRSPGSFSGEELPKRFFELHKADLALCDLLLAGPVEKAKWRGGEVR